jgi:HK97 family phage prohead protease
MERRYLPLAGMTARSADGAPVLEGHFAVFNQEYKVCRGWVETIAPGAFAPWLQSRKDTKVLWNHNHDIVLASTANQTAALREDGKGLWGSVQINPKDQDAVNAHARVERGDVTGCSFGFRIVRMSESWDDDGTYRTRIEEVELYEVSPCTFPAYTGTDINARSADCADAEKIRCEKWRERMLARLKGEHHGS